MKYELLFEKAVAAGISSLEVYESSTKSLTIKVYEGKVDNYESSNVIGASFRGIYNGKQGITFLETLDDSQIDDVIRLIIESAKAIDNKDEVLFNKKIEQYEELPIYNPELDKLNIEEVTKNLLTIEKELLTADKRVYQVPGVEFEESSNVVKIINSYGINLQRKVNYAMLVGEVIVKDGDEVQDNYDYQIKRDLKKFEFNDFAKNIVAEAIKKLKAEKVKTDTYDIIIQNKAMNSLLAALSYAFNGESVNKGLSIIKDKLNQKVFSDKLTIIDNPLLLDGINSTPFDDEGVKCYCKNVVEKGVIKTFLHNLKSAKKANTKPTGNGFKPGYKANVNVSPTNFYIKEGNVSYDDMIKKLNNGVIITDLQGLHAGMNVLTMDFSLQSQGFLVENGKITKRLTLMIVADNLIKLLNDKLDTIGNDIFFNYSGIGSPSILFKNVKVTGK